MRKYLFGLLTFVLIGFINFGYCSTVEDLITVIGSETVVLNKGEYATLVHMSSASDYGTYCIKLSSWVNGSQLAIGFNSSLSFTQNWGYNIYNGYVGKYLCIYSDLDYIFIYNNSQTNNITISYDLFKLNALFDTDLPRMTSIECQRNYGLMPIDEIDQNFCVNNGLCPSSPDVECPGSGDNWSALYINNIQHLGKSIINVTIPDYIFWDYSTDDDVFNLYVGSGYDQDYIDSVLSINSYRPDSGDFTDIFVSGLTLIMPYIVILLFIVFIRKFIKRIFK